MFCEQEDIIVKLIDLMLTPHATTSELLAEKDQVRITYTVAIILFTFTTYPLICRIFQSSKGKKRKRPSKKSTPTSEATPSKSSSKVPPYCL